VQIGRFEVAMSELATSVFQDDGTDNDESDVEDNHLLMI